MSSVHLCLLEMEWSKCDCLARACFCLYCASVAHSCVLLITELTVFANIAALHREIVFYQHLSACVSVM